MSRPLTGQRDPVVTAECLAELRKEQSPVLRHYEAEPRHVDGKLDHYVLIEKKGAGRGVAR